MRFVLALAGGAILFAVAVLIEMPATLVDKRIDSLSGGHLRLVAAQGTLWDGSGELVLQPAGYRRALAWRVERMAFITRGEIAATLASTPDATDAATVVVGRDRLSLHQLSFMVPAEALLKAFDVPASYAAAGGVVRVQIANYDAHGASARAQITADWRGADLPGPRPSTRIALGDIRLEVAGDGPELPGTLRNSGGDVEINGSVVVRPAGALSVDATIKPRAGLAADDASALTSLLGSIGSPDGQGGYRVAWSGK